MNMQTLNEPRLYILVRSDIPQLNPGKLGAQAAHAASKFVRDVFTKSDAEVDEYEAWDEGRGFGTKITLTATEDQIKETVMYANQVGDLMTGVVVDPSYPMTNHYGEYFTRPELTCAYVFATRTTPQFVLDYLRQFKLHP